MSAPTPPRKSKKLAITAIIVAVVLVTLLVPPLVYGGFMVPVAKITFNETTGSLTAGNAQASVQTMTAYEYMLTIRTGAMVRSSDTSVSSSNGVANITMRLELTNPSNQTVHLGNTRISGAMGTRGHTVYLSTDQGVRVPGTYKLDIIITADVSPVVGILQLNLTTSISVNFTVG